MALFLSTTINKVDRKGRVSVPAAFRAVLSGQAFHGIVAFPSFKHSAVQCGGMDWMEKLGAGVDAYDMFSDEHDTLTAALFANAQQLAFDGEGRILLPENLIAHANLSEQAAFVGRGPLFEVWNPATFDAYQADAVRNAAEKGLTLRPGTPPGSEGGQP
ncbi:MAG: division/cell wall cluster transcriptional repressor MraZ [Alphaproteobacteria bacterium]|jgi:MraZ protein|nr:division/cell wall cluster transcriptional repressor MraZ [Alphaproteobacteria bacterium]